MDLLSIVNSWDLGSPIEEVAFIRTLIFALDFVLLFSFVRIYIFRDEDIRSKAAKISFISTMAIMSPTISLIMILVGKDLANAFALLGIMSIIRFRNPSKGAGDVIYYLVAVTIDMTSGKQYYLMAGIFCIFSCGTLVIIKLFSLILGVDKQIDPKSKEIFIEPKKKKKKKKKQKMTSKRLPI